VRRNVDGNWRLRADEAAAAIDSYLGATGKPGDAAERLERARRTA
jgi:hypothetical protein